MRLHLQPSVGYLSLILVNCKRYKNHAVSIRLLAYIQEAGLYSHISVRSELISVLLGVGSHVQQVFNGLPFSIDYLWNTLLGSYVKSGDPQNALKLYDQLLLSESQPTGYGLMTILKACGMLKDLEKGIEIDAAVAKKDSLRNDVFIGTALVDMYAKCGSLERAQEAFDKLESRNLFTWNALISGYLEHGYGNNVLHCFEKMQREGVSPDAITYVYILKACGCKVVASQGQEVHAEITKKGLLEGNVFIGSALIDMYIKCECLWEACDVFDRMQFRDAFAWTSLITGYEKDRLDCDVITFSKQMLQECVLPSAFTVVHCLKASSRIGSPFLGRQMHACIAGAELLESDIYIGCALVDMYSRFGSFEETCKLLTEIRIQNVALWNSLIAGYLEHGLYEQAIGCLRELQREGISPDSITIVCSLRACCSLRALDMGKVLHSESVKRGLETDLTVGSSLVDMYVKCESLVEALETLLKLPSRNVVTWNALIAGYAEHRETEQVFNCLQQMKNEGLASDSVTLICALKSCSSTGNILKCHEIHTDVLQKGLETDIMVGSSLVDTYAKCACIAEACKMFNRLETRNQVSWNALIAGYTEEGHTETALLLFKQMQNENMYSDVVTLGCSLKACGSICAREMGQAIHIEIVKKGLLDVDVFIGSSLVDMYIKCGMLTEAQMVFEQLPLRNRVSVNALISGFLDQGQAEKAIDSFERMQQIRIAPDAVTLISSLKACGNLGSVFKGQVVHAEVVKKGLDMDVLIGSTLIDMYAKCGHLLVAQHVFDKLPGRNVVSWNALIAEYVEQGHVIEALDFIKTMHLEAVSKDTITLSISLKACSCLGVTEIGQDIHMEIIKKGCEGEQIVGNALVDMYCKCNLLLEAVEVFHRINVADTVPWNALISGFTDHGYFEEVFSYYENMQSQGINADSVTFVMLLKACRSISNIEKGQELHNEIVKKGLLTSDLYTTSALIDMYANCGFLIEAQNVFDNVSFRIVGFWNALISGYIESGNSNEALNWLEKMELESIVPDAVTIISTLKACGSIKAASKGKKLHAVAIKTGLGEETNVANTLIDVYVKCGMLVEAQYTLDTLQPRGVVSWTTLIAGYAAYGCDEVILNCLNRMQLEGFQAGPVALACILKACAISGAIVKGHEVHMEIAKKGIEQELQVGNALVDMYAKTGLLREAWEILSRLSARDLVSWNALSAGLSQLGERGTVFHIFSRMQREGVKPDLVTFNSFLNACSHAGDLDVGCMCFEALSSEYLYVHTLELCTSMVDLFGRAGLIDHAVILINRMPFSPGVVAWNTLLGACRKWGHVEPGKYAFEQSLYFDGNLASAYVCMSNIYAGGK